MKRIISWIEPRRSRFEKFSSPEPLDFYITSMRWKSLVFHNHAAKWNEKFGGRAWFKNRNRPNIVNRPIKFQTGLFCMPTSEDRYIRFTPHLASFYLDWLHKLLSNPGGGRGAGTPLYRPYRYVPPHQVGFLRLFFFSMSSAANYKAECSNSWTFKCVVLLRNGAGFTSLKGNSKQSWHFTKKHGDSAILYRTVSEDRQWF